jgi:hypothetical protein
MILTQSAVRPGFRSIFTRCARRERAANFEAYWAYSLAHDGEILEDQKDVARARQRLAGLQADPVRSRRPLGNPAAFYRNHVIMQDDPCSLDRKTLLLTFLYKFARHEFVGISAAWESENGRAGPRSLTAKIGRYHLCEEFAHMRLFEEIFRTFHLDHIEWIPLGKWMSRVYRIFPRFPEAVLAPPAFVSELMGLTVYQHLDGILDDILDDEPEARIRVRQVLREIMTDELAHVGLRRNFIGAIGVHIARYMVPAMYRAFFRDLPEARVLFDLDQMVRDGQTFDYSTVTPQMISQSWVPSYCLPIRPYEVMASPDRLR